MKYERPEAEKITFNNADIITKSSNCAKKTSGHGGSGCRNKSHSAKPSWDR